MASRLPSGDILLEPDEARAHLFAIIAEKLRQPLPPSPPIEPDLWADLDELERSLESALHFARQIRREAGSLQQSLSEPRRLISLKAAGRKAKKHRDTMRAWAERYGIGWRLANGEWVIDEDALDRHLTTAKPKVPVDYS